MKKVNDEKKSTLKNIGFSHKIHELIKDEAFNNQLSMAKYVHRAVLAFKSKAQAENKESIDFLDLSEKIDLIIEQTKPKPRAKKSVAKVEYNCSFQQKLIDYRKEIKKPIKTERGLNQLVASIEECALAWIVTKEQVLEHMMRKEWQSVKPEYENPYTIHQPVLEKVARYGRANNQSIDDMLG